MSSFDFTSYRHLTHFIAGILGDDSEVILYSFEDINNSVIELANSGISGVKLGDPLSSFAVAAMKDKGKAGPPYYLHQVINVKGNKQLNAHFFLILDKRKSPRGMLTVQTDASKYQTALEVLQRLVNVPAGFNFGANKPTNEAQTIYDIDTLQKTPIEMINNTINEVTKNVEMARDRLRTEEKIEIVERLNKDGFFLIKGAVKQTATSLNCSEATIYRYLAQINGK